MKHFLIALMVAFAFCTLTMAQKKATIANDKSDKTRISQTTPKTENEDSDTTDEIKYTDIPDTATMGQDSTVEEDFSLLMDNNRFSKEFATMGDAINGGILLAIIAVIAVFGLPVFVVFIAFYFRYKNRKARYKLAEQALAAGQPLPEEFIKDYQQKDSRSQGIRNTFTGIGLFVFLWAITGSLGIGSIGLLIMFMGLGQWLIGHNQHSAHKNNSHYRNEFHSSEKDQKTE